MPTRLLALLLLVPLVAAVEEVGEVEIRPVLPLTLPQLAALRALVAEDAEAAALAAAAAADAQPWLEREPQPLAVIHYEGLVHTDPRRLASVEALRAMDGVAALVRHWQAGADARAAAALRRQLDAWAAIYVVTGNDVNENKLLPLLVAWHALRPDAEAAQRAAIDRWLTALGERHARAVTESSHLTNRYTKHVRLAVYAGLALDRPEWVALGRAGIERFVSESLRADGTSLDLERRDTLTYHASALKPPLELALVLPDGEALYTWTAPAGGSLKRSVDHVVPYATGEKTRQEWVNSQVELDRRRAAAGIEAYRPGRLYEPRQATELMEFASFFDPALLPLFRRLAEAGEARFPSWRILVHEAIRRGGRG